MSLNNLFFAEAIGALRPDTQWYSIGSKVTFLDGTVPPTESEIQAKIEELQAEYDAQTYSRNRQENYPNTDDLIVALWEKVMEGRSESADALEVKRQEIKTANPKPE